MLCVNNFNKTHSRLMHDERRIMNQMFTPLQKLVVWRNIYLFRQFYSVCATHISNCCCLYYFANCFFCIELFKITLEVLIVSIVVDRALPLFIGFRLQKQPIDLWMKKAKQHLRQSNFTTTYLDTSIDDRTTVDLNLVYFKSFSAKFSNSL